MGKSRIEITAGVFVVIPVHNRIYYTRNCIRSLCDQTISGFSVVVVDDGSIDGTLETMSLEFPAVIVLRGDGTLWWSGSMNLGVKYALAKGADYIVSLNNDLEVAEDYIENMIFWATRFPDVILGSYAFDIMTKKPVFGGSRIDWRKAKTVPLLSILGESERKGLHEVTHFGGRGLWIPAQIFYAAGLFDEKHLEHYASDYDFTLRARKKGFRVFCNYDAKLFSHVEASGDRENRSTPSMKNYWNHLFGIKGGGNLKNFMIIASRHCPKRYFLHYLLRGILARVFGYLRDWTRQMWR